MICEGKICVPLPPCTFAPCMEMIAGAPSCPSAPGGAYTVPVTITNLGAATAYQVAFFACNPNQLPAGAITLQPQPGGLIALSPPLAQNQSTTIPVTLSAPSTGGLVCFCAALFGEMEGDLLCKGMVCVDLPRCECALVTKTDVVCLPTGQYQLTFTVQNNTALSGTPYNFDLGTFSPWSGFSPAVMPSNGGSGPILPGGTGTFAATYSGPPDPKCVTIIFSNAARSRCCPVKVCFDLPECEPAPPDACDLLPAYTCENGSANVTFYLINNSGTPQQFTWSLAPANVLGCTGTLPFSAFTPGSGITATVGPNSAFGVTVNVSGASLLPGQCAGFQVCFAPANNPAAIPVCCTSVLRCPVATDPCIVIGNPGVISPGRRIGIPIIIKNPSNAETLIEMVPASTDGSLEFFRRAAPPADPLAELLPTGLSDAAEPERITGEFPLAFLVQPVDRWRPPSLPKWRTPPGSSSRPAASSSPPCVLDPSKDHLGTAFVLLDTGTKPPPAPAALGADPAWALVTGVGKAFAADGSGASTVTLSLDPGFAQQVPLALESGHDLVPDPSGVGAPSLFAYGLWPFGEGMVLQPDGTFILPAGAAEVSIPVDPALGREFYRLRFLPAADGFSLPMLTR
ncbi:MAG: hypothetical protein R3F11_00655 [Verrucomicrobiales bacterium]